MLCESLYLLQCTLRTSQHFIQDNNFSVLGPEHPCFKRSQQGKVNMPLHNRINFWINLTVMFFFFLFRIASKTDFDFIFCMFRSAHGKCVKVRMHYFMCEMILGERSLCTHKSLLTKFYPNFFLCRSKRVE